MSTNALGRWCNVTITGTTHPCWDPRQNIIIVQCNSIRRPQECQMINFLKLICQQIDPSRLLPPFQYISNCGTKSRAKITVGTTIESGGARQQQNHGAHFPMATFLDGSTKNVVHSVFLKWISVGGRGGSEKTTTSCFLAVALASTSSSVSLVLTDLTRTLSEGFEQKILSKFYGSNWD